MAIRGAYLASAAHSSITPFSSMKTMDQINNLYSSNTKDDASSVYSRTVGSPKRPVSWQMMPIILPIRHNLPEINSLDHQVALVRGTKIALETTRARLRLSKTTNSLTPPELRDEKLLQHEQQEEENIFYRSYFDSFHQPVTAIIESIQDLTLQYHFEPEVNPVGNARLLEAIKAMCVALERSRAQEAEAEQVWKRRWGDSRVETSMTRWI